METDNSNCIVQINVYQIIIIQKLRGKANVNL